MLLEQLPAPIESTTIVCAAAGAGTSSSASAAASSAATAADAGGGMTARAEAVERRRNLGVGRTWTVARGRTTKRQTLHRRYTTMCGGSFETVR